MKPRIRNLAFVALIAGTSPSFAANTVLVESKAVPREADGVTVGVYITNDQVMAGVAIPLEFRSVTAGCYMADILTVQAQNRLTNHLTGVVVCSQLPALDNTNPANCLGRSGFATRGPVDFISPDAIFYAAVAFEDSFLTVGSDGTPPGGTPSLRLTFNVTDALGTFEIDTTCVTPNNHLEFVTGEPPDYVVIIPAFTKGVITIGCDCDCHTDPICDSICTALDYFAVRNVAFGMHESYIDPNPLCPHEDTDVNCDGATDVLDVVAMINVIFRGVDPATEFCVACP